MEVQVVGAGAWQRGFVTAAQRWEEAIKLVHLTGCRKVEAREVIDCV
jgi:hypothetical protein